MLLGELLIHNSIITREHLKHALFYQKRQLKREPIGKILIDLHFITPSILISFLEKQSELTEIYLKDVMNEGEKSKIQQCLIDLEPNIEQIAAKVKDKYKQINLKTNIQIIDIQHVWLFSIIYYIEFFYRNIFSKNNELFLLEIISECLRYALWHFTVEEELVNILDFKINEHSKEHTKFKLEIISKKNLLENPIHEKSGINEKMLIELFSYLRDWSLTHIAVRDKEYVLYLENNIKNRNEVIKQWARQLQEKNLLQITKLQKRFYDIVIESK